MISPQEPSSIPIMSTARLLDTNGEPLCGRPIGVTISRTDTTPVDSDVSELHIYDPFTGISAGTTHTLDKLICLTSNQGYIWVQIEQSSMSISQILAGTITGPSDSDYDLFADPNPKVGIMNHVTNEWIDIDEEEVSNIKKAEPSTIGNFYRFELDKAAIPGKIEVQTLSGQPLEEFNVGGARLGVTFTHSNLPHGFFIYDSQSQSILLSDSSIQEILITYKVPLFTANLNNDMRLRQLIPSAYTISELNGYTNIGLYPDIKMYLHLNYLDEIRQTGIIIFQNPLSKIEGIKEFAEG